MGTRPLLWGSLLTAAVWLHQASCQAPALSPSSAHLNTSVLVVGVITSSQVGCPQQRASDAPARVQLQASMATSSQWPNTAVCAFVGWPSIQALFDTSAQSWEGKVSTLRSRDAVQLLQAPSAPASLNSQVSRLRQLQWSATCQLNSSLHNVAPVLLANSSSQSTGQLMVAVPQAPLQRAAVYSILPASGPKGGGTLVLLQGDSLTAPASCIFSNGTLDVSVSARILNSSAASCTAPAWDFSGPGAALSLGLATSTCTLWQGFTYYADPVVESVQPEAGPRWGSFSMTVFLQQDVLAMPGSQAGFTPEIRLIGANGNGTDLILPAQLSPDRRALAAVTPLEKSPLEAGSHLIHVSLNGQQFLGNQSDSSLRADTMLKVEGPVVAMESPIINIAPNQTQAIIPVTLSGPSMLPVSVPIQAPQQLAAASLASAPAAGVKLQASSLAWASGQAGRKFITLDLDPGADVQSAAVLVQLAQPQNADLDPVKHASLVTGLSPQDLTSSFSYAPNQVFYRDDNVSIPLSLARSFLPSPSAVTYNLSAEAGTLKALPKQLRHGAISSADFGQGSEWELQLPVNWSAVPLEASYRWALDLQPAWLSQVTGNASNSTIAVHLFGVEEGQCPPGTIREGAAEGPVSWAAAPVAAQQTSSSLQLASIVVQGFDSTVYDLSTPFSPDRQQYASIVPEGADSVMLCLLPRNAGSSLAVFDSQHEEVPQVTGIFAASPLSSRKLQGDLSQSPSSSQALQSPQSSASAVACSDRAWSLSLQPGANQFLLLVTAPGAAVSPAQLNASADIILGNLSASTTNASQLYTLSVNRLAPQQHAQLAALNASVNGSDFTLCSNGSTLAAMPVLDAATGDLEERIGMPPACTPGKPMLMNVSSSTEIVLLQPAPALPSIQGLRVEVNGQVLSQGGDVGADQLTDTTAAVTSRDHSNFWPIAVIVGLLPGKALLVPIVVTAEDGITSLSYTVSLFRAALPDEDADQGNSSLTVSYADMQTPPPPPYAPDIEDLPEGWPVPPGSEPWCSACPEGWASTSVDAGFCQMCTPGTYAASAQSPACSACPAGAYANTWGTAACKHCIMGTFSNSTGSRLCTLCPYNLTNIRDGSTACSSPIVPGTNLRLRYAVIVSFGVLLNGTDLGDIASKVGVNASADKVLDQLIASDTANAFNISLQDVNVTSIAQVARRVLQVNITATLAVDVAPGASDEEVEAALAAANLSADEPIGMLASNPDKFFGRTTKALDVTAEPVETPPTRTESRPRDPGRHAGLAWGGALGSALALGILAGCASRRLRKRSARYFRACAGRMPFSGSWKAPWQQQVDEGELEKSTAASISAAGLSSRAKGIMGRGTELQSSEPYQEPGQKLRAGESSDAAGP